MDRDAKFAALQKELRLIIAEAARASFTQVREQLPDEQFYLFALYTSNEYGWMTPTCSGEIGLKQVAAEYATKDFYKDKTLEELEDDLRWSVADSPHFDLAQEPFDEINERLSDFDEYKDANDDWYWTTFIDFVREAMFGGLEDLEREGSFGTGPERDKVVANVLTTDQSNLDIRTGAQRLNPRSALTRLFADLTVPEPSIGAKFLGSPRVREMHAISVAPLNQLIAVAGADYAEVWRYDGSLAFRARISKHSVAWTVALSFNGDELVIGEQHMVRRFSLRDGQELLSIPWTDNTLPNREKWRKHVSSVALSPNKKLLAVGDWSPKITMLELETGNVLWTADQLASSLAFSGFNRYLVAGGSGAWMFDARSGAIKAELASEPRNDVNRHAIGSSLNQAFVVAVNRDPPWAVQIWKGERRQHTFKLPEEAVSGRPTAIAVSPNGDLVATSHAGGDVCVWEGLTGALVTTGRGRWESLNKVTFISQRQVAAVGTDVDKSPPIGLWDVPSFKNPQDKLLKKLFSR